MTSSIKIEKEKLEYYRDFLAHYYLITINNKVYKVIRTSASSRNLTYFEKTLRKIEILEIVTQKITSVNIEDFLNIIIKAKIKNKLVKLEYLFKLYEILK